MENKTPKSVTCGCCSNGCCCFMHRDIPRGRPVAVCDYHAPLPTAPLDPSYRYDATVGDYVRVPVVPAIQS